MWSNQYKSQLGQAMLLGTLTGLIFDVLDAIAGPKTPQAILIFRQNFADVLVFYLFGFYSRQNSSLG